MSMLSHDSLQQRALRWILEQKSAAEQDGVKWNLSAAIDEAGPRFNLGPTDTETLYRVLTEKAES